MYVTEAIEAADRLYPNEYGVFEKIKWVDELNAKIALEYRKRYKAADLFPDTDGEYLAPENVSWENIHSIRVGAKEIKKEDFSTYGIRFIYGIRNRLCVPVNIRRAKDVVRIIYLEAAEKIRVINIKDEDITFDANGFYIDKEVFLFGDIVNVKTEINGREIDKNVNVFKSYLPEVGSTVFYVECDEGAFDFLGLGSEGNEGEKVTANASLRRIITEKTLCPIPYDDMYIQWICAKICFWQKAYDTYNQHMTVFNQLLSDYWHYVIVHSPSDDLNQWKGWY